MIAKMKLFSGWMLAFIAAISAVNLCGESIPSSTLKTLGERIEQTFISVDNVRFLPVGLDRIDVIVIGQQRLMHQSQRVQIFTVVGDHLLLKWDSITLKSLEFTMGPGEIRIEAVNNDYRLSLAGCAQHACYDGILGFLVYSGSAGKAWAAKLKTIDDERGKTLRYDVSWSPNNDTSVKGVDARQALEHNMCHSTGLSDPSKLPFHCSSDNAPKDIDLLKP
jgi:hypothetical protein